MEGRQTAILWELFNGSSFMIVCTGAKLFILPIKVKNVKK